MMVTGDIPICERDHRFHDTRPASRTAGYAAGDTVKSAPFCTWPYISVAHSRRRLGRRTAMTTHCDRRSSAALGDRGGI